MFNMLWMLSSQIAGFSRFLIDLCCLAYLFVEIDVSKSAFESRAIDVRKTWIKNLFTYSQTFSCTYLCTGHGTNVLVVDIHWRVCLRLVQFGHTSTMDFVSIIFHLFICILWGEKRISSGFIIAIFVVLRSRHQRGPWAHPLSRLLRSPSQSPTACGWLWARRCGLSEGWQCRVSEQWPPSSGFWMCVFNCSYHCFCMQYLALFVFPPNSNGSAPIRPYLWPLSHSFPPICSTVAQTVTVSIIYQSSDRQPTHIDDLPGTLSVTLTPNWCQGAHTTIPNHKKINPHAK